MFLIILFLYVIATPALILEDENLDIPIFCCHASMKARMGAIPVPKATISIGVVCFSGRVTWVPNKPKGWRVLGAVFFLSFCFVSGGMRGMRYHTHIYNT